MSWRRVVALAVPLAVLFFVLGFVVGMEVQRGPNWRLELDEHVEDHRLPEETVRLVDVDRASRPEAFTCAMGTPLDEESLTPRFPPQAVRCALLERSMPLDDGAGDGRRQVVFVVRHSDALYRVGWTVYEGAEEPFDADARVDLDVIGCDLALDDP